MSSSTVEQPVTASIAKPTTAQAKERFMEAARAIDPIGAARSAVKEHPFVTVGAALTAGAVVGASSGRFGPISRTLASILKLAKPLALSAAEMAASRVAAHYAPPAPAPDAAPSTDGVSV